LAGIGAYAAWPASGTGEQRWGSFTRRKSGSWGRPPSRIITPICCGDGFHDRGFERELTARIVDEARRHHINELRVHEQTTSRSYQIPALELHTYANG
jgi:hypothetical protein